MTKNTNYYYVYEADIDLAIHVDQGHFRQKLVFRIYLI